MILCMAGCRSGRPGVVEVTQNDLECNLLVQAKWGEGPGELGYIPEGQSSTCFPHKPVRFQIDVKGNIYVADLHNERVMQFSSTGDFVRNFSVPISDKNECIRDIDVGSGRLAVATTDHIYIYDHPDAPPEILEWPAGAGEYGLCSEDTAGRMVQADEEGNIYACGVGGYERGGTIVQYDAKGHSRIFFTGYYDHFVVGWDGLIYIEQIDYETPSGDTSGSRVLKFDSQGEQVGEMIIRGRDLAEVNLLYPGLVTEVDAKGNLYTNVVNVYRNGELVPEAVIRINEKGNISYVIERNMFTRPSVDVIDRNGNLYIWRFGEVPSGPAEIWRCNL